MQVFTQKTIITIPLSVLKIFIAAATQITEDEFFVSIKYQSKTHTLKRCPTVEEIVTIDGVPVRDEALEMILNEIDKTIIGENVLISASGVYYAITMHPTLKVVVINVGRA